MPALKIRASAIQTPLQIVASLTETSWDLRWKMPKSRASMARMKALKPTHSQRDVSCIEPISFRDRPWGARPTARVACRGGLAVGCFTYRKAGRRFASVLTASRPRGDPGRLLPTGEVALDANMTKGVKDSTARLQSPAMDQGHPEPELLARYARGELTREGSRALEAHLADCLSRSEERRAG